MPRPPSGDSPAARPAADDRGFLSDAAAANLLAVVVALGAVIRFSAARNLPMHVDEAASILAADRIADRGVPVLPSGALYLQGALHAYLLAPLVAFGASAVDDLTLLRLPGALAGVLALYLMFRLGLATTRRADAALLGAALLAVDPLSVRWSGLARMYSLLQALTLALAWLFLRMLARPAGPRAVGGFVLLFAAAVFTQVEACLLLPAMAAAAWLCHGRGLARGRRDLVVALGLCAIPPLALVGLNRLAQPPGQPADGSTARFAFVGDYFLSFDRVLHPSLAAWSATFPHVPLAVLLRGLLVAGTGFVAARRLGARGRPAGPSRVAGVAVLACGYWIPILIVGALVPEAEDRYLLFVHPLGLLLLVLTLIEAERAWTTGVTGVARPRVAGGLAGPSTESAAAVASPVGAPPPATASERVLSGPRRRGRLAALAGVGVPTLLGLAVRAAALDRLSLWLDEGFTVLYARLPWRTVLGLDGFYSPHPPLYFALAKAASLLVPERLAGRLLSLIASVAAIAVVWALGDRLFGRRAAFVAALALALAPIHVYYGQEGRMYALVVLLVATAYLALVAFVQAPSRRWAAVYGLAVAVALYADYSAAFALAPQAVLLAFALDRHRRRAAPIGLAAVSAVLAYAPWLPRVVASVHAANRVGRREAYLGVDPTKVPTALLGLLGLAGDGSYLQSTVAMPWNAAPALRPLLLLVVVVVGGLAGAALAKNQLAALVVGCLFGTVAVAVWVSQVSPSFAERTVLTAVVGWALVVGAAEARAPRTALGRLGSVAVAAALIASAYGTYAVDTGATKQRWRDAVADLATAEPLGFPVVTYSYGEVADTFLDLYAPGLRGRAPIVPVSDGQLEAVLSNGLLAERGLTLAEAQAGGLAAELGAGGARAPYVWVLYYQRPGTDDLLATLAALGYQRIEHGAYDNPRYLVDLDLFALPGAAGGQEVPVNGGFAARAAGWQLPPHGVTVGADAGGVTLAVSGNGPGEPPTAAAYDSPGGGGLYELSLDLRGALDPQALDVTLACRSTDGNLVAQSTLETGPLDGAIGSDWGRHRLAVVCPPTTASVRLALGVAGTDQATFRDVRLSVVPFA